MPGQQLTRYNRALLGVTSSVNNPDDTAAPVTLLPNGFSGPHAVHYIWDGVWIRVQ